MTVSEKTLELNLSCEILNAVRRDWSKDAIIIGFSTRKESFSGVDSQLANIPSDKTAMIFQYKRPHTEVLPMKFWINTDTHNKQHDALARMASGMRGAAFYVFPLLYNYAEVLATSPDLLKATVFCDITKFPRSMRNV